MHTSAFVSVNFVIDKQALDICKASKYRRFDQSLKKYCVAHLPIIWSLDASTFCLRHFLLSKCYLVSLAQLYFFSAYQPAISLSIP